MNANWKTVTSRLALAVSSAVLAAACSGDADFEDPAALEGEQEFVETEDGVVLGASWQSLYYPYCMSPWSDPDGDGWGWEWGYSCIVYRPPTQTYTPPSYGGGSSSGSSTCANPDGTASTMAAIAVATAMELKRWQPKQDFQIVRGQNYQEYLALTSTGKSRCSDGVCLETQALLDMQNDAAEGQVVFPGNVKLSAAALRSRLVAKFREQLTCEAQPSNGGSRNCPAEEHTLTFQRSEKGGCDTNFYFVAKSPNGQALRYPAQLKNKLQWVDQHNPYIGFQSVGEVVSIDPTYGLNEAGSSTSGSCTAACTKISRSNVSGQCCTCNGATRTYQRSPWNSSTYLCK